MNDATTQDMNQQILKVFGPIFEIQSQHTELTESFHQILLNYCKMLESYHDLSETIQKTIASMADSYNGSSIIETSTSLIKTLTETAPVSDDDRYAIVDKNSVKFLDIPDYMIKSATTSSTGGLILTLQRVIVTARPAGRCRKPCYWSTYKVVLLESSFLDSSACSFIYFCTASSVILPIVST